MFGLRELAVNSGVYFPLMTIKEPLKAALCFSLLIWKFHFILTPFAVFD